MAARAQTIQIFLPHGNPQGTRVAEITTRTVRVFDIPRSLLSEFLAMPEASQVGVYFLFSEDESSDSPNNCYIGQSGIVGNRLGRHLQEREFWTRAIVAISLTNNITDTHARYLEWASIRQANSAGRYVLENGNAGSRPHTPAPLEADCEEILESIRVLIGTLGFPVLEPLPTATTENADEIIYCTARGSDAKGVFSAEGVTVLKGSRCAVKPTPGATPKSIKARREKLFEQGVLTLDDSVPVFSRDYLFKSPSGASCAVIYRTSNGWKDWKTASGQELGATDAKETPPGD